MRAVYRDDKNSNEYNISGSASLSVIWFYQLINTFYLKNGSTDYIRTAHTVTLYDKQNNLTGLDFFQRLFST